MVIMGGTGEDLGVQGEGPLAWSVSS